MGTRTSRNRAEGKRRIAACLAFLCLCVLSVSGGLAAADEKPAAEARDHSDVPKDKLYANDPNALWLLAHSKPRGIFPGRPIPSGPRARTVRDDRRVRSAWLRRHTLDAYLKREKPSAPWRKEAAAFMADALKVLAKAPDAPSAATVEARGADLIAKGVKDPAFVCLNGLLWEGDLDARRKALLERAEGFALNTYSWSVTYLVQMQLRRGLIRTDRPASGKWLNGTIEAIGEAAGEGEFAYGEAPIAYDIIMREVMWKAQRERCRRSILWRLKRKRKRVDPWLLKLVEGRVEIDKAWKVRGGGTADSVREKGWRGFEEHLTKARAALTEAWKLHPGRPEAATEMITVAMAGHAGPGETPRFWFDRAVAARMDYMQAYRALEWATRPRWGGTHEHLLAFGVECLATKRFDTEVPWHYLRCLRIVGDELQPWAWRALFRTPGARARLPVLFKGMLARAAAPDERNPLLTLQALTEAWGGDYARAAKTLARTPPKTPLYVTNFCPLPRGVPDRRYFEGELRAFNGPHKALLERAEGLSLEGRVDESLPLFLDVLKKTKADPARRAYLCKRAALLLMSAGPLASHLCGARSPLYVAAREGDTRLVQFIAENGGDLNEGARGGWTPLLIAIWNRHAEIVELLLKHGADVNTPNNRGLSPLYTAIRRGPVKLADELIRRGADVAARDIDGWRAIHFAARYGPAEIVKRLIGTKGVDLNHQSIAGWSPLHLAIRNGHTQAAELLIRRGADVNARMGDGWTALHFALRYGEPGIAKALIEKGAKVNAETKPWLWTPLHFAAGYSTPELVRLLLDRGANPKARTNKGTTPLSMAESRNRAEAVRALKQLESKKAEPAEKPAGP